MGAVTLILDRPQQEVPSKAAELLPLLYEELHKLAAARMAKEAAGNTLQPTALLHEAWLRLTENNPEVRFANRAHFSRLRLKPCAVSWWIARGVSHAASEVVGGGE